MRMSSAEAWPECVWERVTSIGFCSVQRKVEEGGEGQSRQKA